MKNVIKRGTSLLLVLAMLLSFAAVVGAEEPTTPEKILTLTVANVALKVGENLIPVYASVTGNYYVSLLQFSAESSNNEVVHIDTIYPGKPAGKTGTGVLLFEGSALDTVIGGTATYSPENQPPAFGWTSRVDGFTGTPTLPICYIKVTAKENVAAGAYQINICKNPDITDGCVFATFVSTTQVDNHYENETTLNAGTAVVFPEGADTTVFLTQDTFAAPTWENRESGGVYDLGDYLKIAKAEADGSVSIYPVDKSSLSITGNTLKGATLENNVLSVGTGVTNGGDTKLTVTAAQGGGVSLSAPATVTVKVSKEALYRKYIGFGNNKTYAPAPTTTQTIEVEAYSTPGHSKFYPLDAGYPATFDQYGVEMSEKAKLEVVLYSDDTFKTQLSNTNEAYNYVAPGDTSLEISNQLKKDVWCMVKTYVETESTGAKTYGDQTKVHIISQYPQAKTAVIKLTDGNDNPFSGTQANGTFDIPGGSGETTIKFVVEKFKDKNGDDMKVGTAPTDYTIKATQTSPAAAANDVTISIAEDGKSGTITVGSGAVKDAPVEIAIKAVVDGAELDGMTITLKKGDSCAMALASYDSTSKSYAKGEIRVDAQEGNALPTVLPGIRETDSASVVLAPLYVLDQYDQPISGEYAEEGNFQLYKVDGNTKTPIGGDYAKYVSFTNGTEHRVILKLTNGLLGSDLALTAGTYQIQANYNGKEASSAEFTLTEGEAELSGTPIYYDVETGSEPTLYVPYKYGTLDSAKKTTMKVGADIKTQYGKAYAPSELPKYTLSEVKLNGEAIENSAITYTVEADNSEVTFTVDKSAAQLFGTSDTATLAANMTVTIGEKSTQSIPISIKVEKEASVLSAVKVEMAEDAAFTTGLKTWSADRTSESKEGEVTLLSPNANKTWYVRRTAEDQYGVEMDITGLVTATGCSWSYDTDKATGKILYFKLGVPAGHEDSFILQFPNKNPEYKFTAKFVPMEFVKSLEGKDDTFQLRDYLNQTANEDGTFSDTYNGSAWSTILAKKDGATVYIKTAEGENNTEIPADKLTLEVTKDGATVEQTGKANAGEYQVKLVYTDENGQKYTVDEKTFTISPKELELQAKSGTKISKVYDGTDTYPTEKLSELKLSDYFEITSGTISGDSVALKDVAPTQVKFLTTDAAPASDAADGLKAVVYMPENALTDSNYKLKPVQGKSDTVAFAADGEITKKPVTVTITVADKEWDGTKNGTVTAAITDGVLTADKDKVTLNVATPTAEIFANSDAGSGLIEDLSPLNKFGLTLAGDKARNYDISKIETPSSIDVQIKPATFTIKLNKAKEIVYGCDADVLKFTKDELYRGDTKVESSLTFTEAELTLGLQTPDGTAATTNSNGHYNVISNREDRQNYYLLTAPTSTNQNYEFKLGGNYTTLSIRALQINVTLATGSEQKLTKVYDGTTDLKTGVTANDFVLELPTGITAISDETYSLDVSTLKYYQDANAGDKTITASSGGCLTVNGTLVSKKPNDVSVKNYTVDLSGLTGKITAKAIDDNTTGITITQTDNPALTYNGKEQTLHFEVKDGNTTLVEGTDYEITGNTGIDAGSYPVTVTFKGNYSGSKTGSGTIEKYKGEIFPDPGSGVYATATRGQTTEITVPLYVPIAANEFVKKPADNTGTQLGKLAWDVATDKVTGAEVTAALASDGKSVVVTVKLPDEATVGETFRLQLDAGFEAAANHKNIERGQAHVFVIQVTDKKQQTDFHIAPATGNGTYSYSQGGVQMIATDAKGEVEWTITPITGTATIDPKSGKVTFGHPGTVQVKATSKETTEYAERELTYTLVIEPGVITVTASSATITAGDPMPGFTATATGLNPLDSVEKVFETLTASAGTDGKTAGTFRVTPNAVLKTTPTDWNDYYTVNPVYGTLTVNPAQTAIDVVLPIIIGGNTCANGYVNCACEIFYDLDASRWYHDAVDWAYNLSLMNGTTKTTFGPNAAATRAQTWTMLARIAGQDTRRSSTWYEVGQKWAMNLGITDGTNPMGSLTREQLAAMLYRYVGSPAVNGTLTFTDSANVSTWARNAMIWAVQNGILDGVGGNRLNPKGTTTRAQAAAIFMRFSKLINK